MLSEIRNTVVCGDSLEVLKTLPDTCIDCVVTSPPYWALRDYGVDGQLGLEPTFQEYITKLCNIFDEVKRVLKKDGTCWVNLGDTYSGMKVGNTEIYKNPNVVNNNFVKPKSDIQDKCLIQIPSRFAIEMTNRGWILRNEIIWHKPNCMPSSVKDRFTVDFEKVFFFVKSKKYYFEQQFEKAAMNRWGGHSPINMNNTKDKHNQFGGLTRDRDMMLEFRNKRVVWSINTKPSKEEHYAMFPDDLIKPMIQAGCPKGGIVLDPFIGLGQTGCVAKRLDRNYIGIELSPKYVKRAEQRISQIGDLFLNINVEE